jgi:hypothetical protein
MRKRDTDVVYRIVRPLTVRLSDKFVRLAPFLRLPPTRQRRAKRVGPIRTGSISLTHREIPSKFRFSSVVFP